jgi:hypothetical protein
MMMRRRMVMRRAVVMRRMVMVMPMLGCFQVLAHERAATAVLHDLLVGHAVASAHCPL